MSWWILWAVTIVFSKSQNFVGSEVVSLGESENLVVCDTVIGRFRGSWGL